MMQKEENKQHANNLLILLLVFTLTAERAVNLVYPFHLLDNFINLTVFTASHDIVDLFELLNTSVVTESVHFPLKDQENKQPVRFRVNCSSDKYKLLIRLLMKLLRMLIINFTIQTYMCYISGLIINFGQIIRLFNIKIIYTFLISKIC